MPKRLEWVLAVMVDDGLQRQNSPLNAFTSSVRQVVALCFSSIRLCAKRDSCYLTSLPSQKFVDRFEGCRMKTVHGRYACSWYVMAIVFAGMSGCTIGGKSFTMDSNSRIPFFGLELKERKPKSTAPVYQSIARKKDDPAEVKVALQVDTTKRSASTANNRAATSVPGMVIDRGQVSFNRRSTDSTSSLIALPLTEGTGHERSRSDVQCRVDFQ